MIIEFWDEGTKALQCSSKFFSHFCRFSGRGTTTALASTSGRGNYKSFLRVAMPNGATANAMMAIRIDGGYQCGFMGNQGEAGFRRYASDAPGGTGFSYYVFDTAEVLPDVDAAVKLWEEGTNKVRFSSAYYPMVILGVLTSGDLTFPTYQVATFQGRFGGGRDVGEPICYVGGVPVPDEGNCDEYAYDVTGTIASGFVSTSGDRAGINYLVWDSNRQRGSTVPRPWFTPGEIAIVDVTYIPIGQTFF